MLMIDDDDERFSRGSRGAPGACMAYVCEMRGRRAQRALSPARARAHSRPSPRASVCAGKILPSLLPARFELLPRARRACVIYARRACSLARWRPCRAMFMEICRQRDARQRHAIADAVDYRHFCLRRIMRIRRHMRRGIWLR